MGLLVAVAGAYVGAYTPGSGASGAGGGAGSIGILADTGYNLHWTIHKQKIGNDGTDIYGQTLLESIYRGADWGMVFRAREYSAAAMNVAWPYTKVSGGGALSPVLSGIGVTDTGAFAGSLVMTAVAGTTASNNPATFTASSCAADSGSNSNLEFTSRLRELPMALSLYPYVSALAGTPKVWFVTT